MSAERDALAYAFDQAITRENEPARVVDEMIKHLAEEGYAIMRVEPWAGAEHVAGCPHLPACAGHCPAVPR